MAHWLAVVPEEQFFAERLFHHDTIEVPAATTALPAVGDDVVLMVGGGKPLVFGLGRIGPPADTGDRPGDTDDADVTDAPLPVTYTHRLLDDPIPASELDLPAVSTGTATLTSERFAACATHLLPRHALAGPRREWLVSVDLPIEATSQPEAVRQFWSYVMALGPRELPAFVAPADDELAMQAYVLGEETELDPEDADEG